MENQEDAFRGKVLEQLKSVIAETGALSRGLLSGGDKWLHQYKTEEDEQKALTKIATDSLVKKTSPLVRWRNEFYGCTLLGRGLRRRRHESQ